MQIFDFNDGVAVVEKDGKYNFIDTEHNLLCDEWFDEATDFYIDSAVVMKSNKYNLVDKNGKPLFKEWVSDLKDLEKYGVYTA